MFLMSPEVSFLKKIKSTYSLTAAVDTTPLRQSKYLEKTQILADIGSRLGISNMYFLEAVFHPNGKVYGHKIIKMERSIKRLRENYGDDAVELLQPECVRKNGSINFKKFRQVIKSSI